MAEQHKENDKASPAANPALTQGRDANPATPQGAKHQTDATVPGDTPDPQQVREASDEASDMLHKPHDRADPVHPGPNQEPRERPDKRAQD